MQNEPNLPKAQMNVTKVITKEYEHISNWTLGENEPNTNPIKANLLDAQMNVSSVLTKDYENVPLRRLRGNKPNTDPIKLEANLSLRERRSLRVSFSESSNRGPISKAKKCPDTVISHFFKQFEKKLVTARQSRDYLENREKDKRNKSFISGEIWPE